MTPTRVGIEPPTPHPCGWEEYPFWRCSQGHRFDLRLQRASLRAPLLPNYCPGCGVQLAIQGALANRA